MKKTHYSGSQIINILKQAEAGIVIEVTQSTFYEIFRNWSMKHIPLGNDVTAL